MKDKKINISEKQKSNSPFLCPVEVRSPELKEDLSSPQRGNFIYKQNYYIKNKKRIQEYAKQYYKRTKEIRKEHVKGYYEKTKKERKEHVKEYCIKNSFRRIAYNKKWREKNQIRCRLDHKNPLSRGGTNEKKNLDIAHFICNCQKHNKTEEEYREWLAKKEN